MNAIDGYKAATRPQVLYKRFLFTFALFTSVNGQPCPVLKWGMSSRVSREGSLWPPGTFACTFVISFPQVLLRISDVCVCVPVSSLSSPDTARAALVWFFHLVHLGIFLCSDMRAFSLLLWLCQIPSDGPCAVPYQQMSGWSQTMQCVIRDQEDATGSCNTYCHARVATVLKGISLALSDPSFSSVAWTRVCPL